MTARQRGAQPGNNNAGKNREFSELLRKIGKRREARNKKGKDAQFGLEGVVHKVWALAEAGDMQAINFVAERLEGKVPQMLSGDPNAPVFVQFLPEDRDA